MANSVSTAAVAQQVLLGPPVVDSSYRLEVISKDSDFVSRGASTQAVAQQILLSTSTLVNHYSVEVISKDGSFVLPNSVRTEAVAQQIALTQPTQRLVNNYTVEVIASENVTVPLALYATEILSGLPYSATVDNVALEVVGVSTIMPPQPSQRAVWFTIN